MDEHQGRKSEMDAREEKIANVLATGEQMMEKGHFAVCEVSEIYPQVHHSQVRITVAFATLVFNSFIDERGGGPPTAVLQCQGNPCSR